MYAKLLRVPAFQFGHHRMFRLKNSGSKIRPHLILGFNTVVYVLCCVSVSSGLFFLIIWALWQIKCICVILWFAFLDMDQWKWRSTESKFRTCSNILQINFPFSYIFLRFLRFLPAQQSIQTLIAVGHLKAEKPSRSDQQLPLCLKKLVLHSIQALECS